MDTYEVRLYKAIKGDEKRHFKNVTSNPVNLFSLPKLCESVEGRMLIGRFANLCLTRKSTGVTYLVAKQVGVLGRFTSEDLNEEIKRRGTNPQFEKLIKDGYFLVGTDYHLFLFKGCPGITNLTRAFTERYFATNDLRLDVSPWGAARRYFIEIEKIN